MTLWHNVYLSIVDNDNLFIADSKGDQIFLLNSHLKVIQILLDRMPHGIDQPWRLCYLPDKQQLIVRHGWPASEDRFHFDSVFYLFCVSTIIPRCKYLDFVRQRLCMLHAI